MKQNSYNQDNCTYDVNIGENSSNIQIQQGTVNSSQTQTINEVFDYENAMQILNEISKYKSMFADVYGEDSKIAEETLDEAIKAVEKKEKPSKIKTALSVLKDITLRVSSSVIATGILGFLKQLNI